MKIRQTNEIEGVFEIILAPFSDHRGFWLRTYDEQLFTELGITSCWVQENHSKNLRKNTIRGMHFCLQPYTESKLIRCIRGKVYDVFIDLRKDSLTFGRWDSVKLSEDDFKWLLLPKGMAHGFCTLEDNSELIYKHDTYYHKEFDIGILWNDADLKIDWPVNNPIISEKDSKLMNFNDFLQKIGGL